MSAQVQHALTLISLLHPQPTSTALIEITGLAPKTRPVKDYYVRADVAAERGIELNNIGYSVFVNVNPRNAMSAFESNVSAVTAVALDLQPERISFDEVERRLLHAGLPPTAAAISGYGAHMYFIVEPAEAVRSKIVWERLCKYTTSDPIHSLNRIMRLPGTRNLKRESSAWCYLVGVWPERHYTIAHIDSRLNAVGAGPARPVKEGIPVPVDPPEDWFELRKRLAPNVLDIIDTGERNAYSEKQISRSEADWVVVCALVNAGCPDEMIHWVYEKTPVGIMKYREAGIGYLTRTIESARRSTAVERSAGGTARGIAYAPRFTGGAGDSARMSRFRKM